MDIAQGIKNLFCPGESESSKNIREFDFRMLFDKENQTKMRSIVNYWEALSTLEGHIENHSNEKIHTTFFQFYA